MYEFGPADSFLFPTTTEFTEPTYGILGYNDRLKFDDNTVIWGQLFVTKFEMRIEYFCETDEIDCDAYFYSRSSPMYEASFVLD